MSERSNNMESVIGLIVLAIGAVLLLASVFGFFVDKIDGGEATFLVVTGTVLILVGTTIALGKFQALLDKLQGLKNVSVGSEGAKAEFASIEADAIELKAEVKKRELSETQRRDGQSYAETKVLPDQDAGGYTAVVQTRVINLLVGPSAHPMTPMYLLDKDYRILDWNEAFSLAFDRTMEGRLGKSILEWTYHLSNFQEVLDHGEQVFADPQRLPMHDTETIGYTSLRYGKLTALKHAYQIGDRDGRCAAWLVSLDVDFADPEQKSRYRYELLKLIGLDQLWSEYAINYDRVLTNTRIYPELVDTLLGIQGPLAAVPNDARVLDLGAGSGNLTRRLMDGVSNRVLFALDNNRVMLEFLRDKCRDYLREDDLKPGVLVIKQDVTSLYGLDDDYFDVVVANNVFYALADPEACLEAVYRVLRPGGELRMSGPRVDTDLDLLFERIRADLEERGRFEELKPAYDQVEFINRQRLVSMLHKWTTDDFCRLLEGGGFEVTHRSDAIYAGQSMLVTAIKPARGDGSLAFEIPS